MSTQPGTNPLAAGLRILHSLHYSASASPRRFFLSFPSLFYQFYLTETTIGSALHYTEGLSPLATGGPALMGPPIRSKIDFGSNQTSHRQVATTVRKSSFGRTWIKNHSQKRICVGGEIGIARSTNPKNLCRATLQICP